MQLRLSCSVIVAASLLTTASLAAQGQMGNMDMNNLPYDSVRAMLSDPARRSQAMEMAKTHHVILMAGQPVEGRSVTLKGELTGANCYLSGGLRGHEHAMCAKACVSAGSPVVFIAEDGTVYGVLTGVNGMPLPKEAYDDLGRPGVTVRGKAVKSHGLNMIAIESVAS